jgi:hypothetical protein
MYSSMNANTHKGENMLNAIITIALGIVFIGSLGWMLIAVAIAL